MTKILNLDTIETKVDKTIVLNGVEHAFSPFTVEQFIEQLKEIEAIENGERTLSIREYAEYSIKSIKRAFPTVPEAELRALHVDKLKAISDFVRGEVAAEAEAGAEIEAGNGEGETANS